MLVLDEADIERLLTMDDALPAVRSALLDVYQGTAVNLAKERAAVHGETLHSVGAVLRTGEGSDHTWHGATIYVSGSVRDHWTLVFNGKGLTAAVAGKRLSRLRTGAATGVSADALAAPGPVTVACLGAGYQAWTQVEAVSRVRPIGRLLVWSRTRERAESFAAQVSDRQGLAATPVGDVAAAVADADIVIAITKARDPIVLGRDVRPGAHVILAGSSHVDRREADADLFARASAVFADDLDLARAHSGDLIAAVESGALRWADVRHLGAALTGPGAAFRRETPDGISVFCNHGVGSWDLELAMTAISRARSQGNGTELDLVTGWLAGHDAGRQRRAVRLQARPQDATGPLARHGLLITRGAALVVERAGLVRRGLGHRVEFGRAGQPADQRARGGGEQRGATDAAQGQGGVGDPPVVAPRQARRGADRGVVVGAAGREPDVGRAAAGDGRDDDLRDQLALGQRGLHEARVEPVERDLPLTGGAGDPQAGAEGEHGRGKILPRVGVDEGAADGRDRPHAGVPDLGGGVGQGREPVP